MRDLKRKDKLVEAAGDAYGKTLSLLTLDVCSDEFCLESGRLHPKSWYRSPFQKQSLHTSSAELTLVCEEVSSAVVCVSLKVTKKVIESPWPPFRNLTNPLYTPIVALKYADETRSLSVHTFYHMLYNLGGVMHVSVRIMKFLSFGWLRRRAISPT